MPGFDRGRVVGETDQYLDEFTCGICQEIFCEPVVTQCCRQTYCKSCIDEWLTKRNTCPNDRRYLRSTDLIPASRTVFNLLNNMQIKCEYQSNGCQVITTIGELTKHLEVCDRKPGTNCNTCGVLIDNEGHNCIANMVNIIKNFADELNRLRAENQELKNKNKAIYSIRGVDIAPFLPNNTEQTQLKQKQSESNSSMPQHLFEVQPSTFNFSFPATFPIANQPFYFTAQPSVENGPRNIKRAKRRLNPN